MRFITTQPYRSSSFSNQFFNEMDQWFDEFAKGTPAYNEQSSLDLATEVVETDDHILLSVDAPGIKKEDLNIELNDNVLTISGSRKKEWSSNDKMKVQRNEKSYGTFSRSFHLTSAIQADKIEACFEQGVLEVYLPKNTKAKSQKVAIQSGQQKGGFFSKLIKPSTSAIPASEENISS